MGTSDYKIEARTQKGWNWMVATYLFLGGVGSGAYVVGAIAGMIGPGMKGWIEISRVGVGISLPAVGLGLLFLLAHLGQPMKSYLAPSKAATSWISRGTLFAGFFLIFSLIHIIALIFKKTGGPMDIVAVLGIICALGTMAYTGALLSASKGVPFWESGLLPILFLFSALVTGLGAVLFLGYIAYSGKIDAAITMKLAVSAMGLLVAEAIVLFFFLNSSLRLPDTKEPAAILLKKGSFVFGDLILGLLVPFLLMAMIAVKKGEGTVAGLMIVAGLLALIGGLLLRFGILSVGMRASYNISGFDFKLQTRLDPKPIVGRVPPGNV